MGGLAWAESAHQNPQLDFNARMTQTRVRADSVLAPWRPRALATDERQRPAVARWLLPRLRLRACPRHRPRIAATEARTFGAPEIRQRRQYRVPVRAVHQGPLELLLLVVLATSATAACLGGARSASAPFPGVRHGLIRIVKRSA
jgi:hypothetical protein